MPTNFSEGANLYINGHETITESFGLVTEGGNGGHLPLFVQVDNPTEFSNIVSLSTYGSEVGETNSSQKSLALFTKSINEVQANLFIKVDDIGYFDFSKSLVILGDNKILSKNINLFLHNDGLSDGATLFIKGLGINRGWYPKNNYMNMYIERDYEAIGSSVNMYVSANELFFEDMDLITYGKTTYDNSLNLFNVGGTASFNKKLNLYTHGF